VSSMESPPKKNKIVPELNISNLDPSPPRKAIIKATAKSLAAPKKEEVKNDPNALGYKPPSYNEGNHDCG
jgi:hypothetical protein